MATLGRSGRGGRTLERLIEDWSPQQIAGFRAVMHPDDPEMRVSYDTIYKTMLTSVDAYSLEN